MKEKLMAKMLSEMQNESVREQLDDLMVSDISTIHAFLEKLLKRNIAFLPELEGFSVLDEKEAQKIMSETFAEAIEEFKTAHLEKYKKLVFTIRSQETIREIIFLMNSFFSAQAGREEKLKYFCENIDLFVEKSKQYLNEKISTTVNKILNKLNDVFEENDKINSYLNEIKELLNKIKSSSLLENLITLKTGIEDYLREDGYVLVNGDDESLANHKFKHKVRYYGLNKKNDYYADNINIKGVSMTFDIVDKILDNRFTITLDLLGEHNIYNVLVSYATGKIAGLSDEEIILGLKSFKTTGIRQNYVKINGYNLFIDCYNAAPTSVKNALKVVKDIEVEKGNKKIAVLGDMLELGKDEIDLHREIGKAIKDYDIDYLFCYGILSKYIADEAKKVGVKTVYSDDKEVIVKEVKKVMKHGDLILFKASNGMNLPEIIDKLFKTEFSKKK